MSSCPPIVALPDWHQRQRDRDDGVRRLKFDREMMAMTGGDHASPNHLDVTRDALCLSLLSVAAATDVTAPALTAEGWRELLRSGCPQGAAAVPLFPEPLNLASGSASVPESEVFRALSHFCIPTTYWPRSFA